MLRYDPHIGKNGHEIRVPPPSRHNVEMKVVLQAGPGVLTKIQAYIEPIRAHFPAKYFNASAYQAKDIAHLLRTQAGQSALVPARGRQKMPVGIGISVHYHHG